MRPGERDDATTRARGVRRRGPWAGGLPLALLVACHADETGRPATPRPTAEGPSRVASTEACGACHAAAYATWSTSLHRASYSDPWFQAGYAVDHRAFCRDCHAPGHRGVDPAADDDAAIVGVGCTDCHRVPVGHGIGPQPRAVSTRACGDCHEFGFPQEDGPRRYAEDARMQRTVDEWRQSGTTETCVSCHMAAQGGHRDHASTVLASPARLADALRVEAHFRALGDSTEVEVHITSVGVGHAVPTGDLFRALELEVRTDTVTHPPRLLRRRFGPRYGSDGAGLTGVLAEVEDTRVPPVGARVERFVFPGAPTSVHVRLDHLRVVPSEAARQGLPPGAGRTPLIRRWLTRH